MHERSFHVIFMPVFFQICSQVAHFQFSSCSGGQAMLLIMLVIRYECLELGMLSEFVV